jgi:hypothetical protein
MRENAIGDGPKQATIAIRIKITKKPAFAGLFNQLENRMFAFVIADRPNDQTQRVKSGYRTFEEEADDIAGLPGSKTRPSENIWMLELPEQTALLSALVHASQNKGFGLRVLYFQDAPQEYVQPPSVKD